MNFFFCLLFSLSLIGSCLGKENSEVLVIENKKKHKIHSSEDAFYGIIVFEKEKELVAFESKKAGFRLVYGTHNVREHLGKPLKISVSTKLLNDMVSIPFMLPGKDAIHGRAYRKFKYYIANKQDYKVSVYYRVFDKGVFTRVVFPHDWKAERD